MAPPLLQDRRTHGLLAGGRKALDEIFPGFERDLAGGGAVPERIAQDARYERAQMLATAEAGFRSIRPLCVQAAHRVFRADRSSRNREHSRSLPGDT
jgi:hypothetical protein